MAQFETLFADFIATMNEAETADATPQPTEFQSIQQSTKPFPSITFQQDHRPDPRIAREKLRKREQRRRKRCFASKAMETTETAEFGEIIKPSPI